MKYKLHHRSAIKCKDMHKFVHDKVHYALNTKILRFRNCYFTAKIIASTALYTGLQTPLFAAENSIIENHSTFLATVLVGVSVFALYVGRQYSKQKQFLNEQHAHRSLNIQIINSRLSRVERALAQSNIVFLVWTGRSQIAEVMGNTHIIEELPKDNLQIAKWQWLCEESQNLLNLHLGQLRSIGQEFSQSCKTINHKTIIINGCAQGSDIILTLQPESNVSSMPAADFTQATHILTPPIASQISKNITAASDMLNLSVYPSWLRNEDGKLTWVNTAYVDAVDSTSVERVVAEQIELLDEAARKFVLHDVSKKGQFRGRLTGVNGSSRANFEVFEVKTDNTSQGAVSQGMAINITGYLTGTQDLERQLSAHKNTLEHIPIAVAMFNASKELVFHNAAFEKLWRLEPNFIAEKPSESRILDSLREKNLLPEQADFKKWKSEHLEIYHASSMKEEWWHCPKGKTIHVLANPNPAGGVIYFYEDVSRQISIETQYNSLMQLQHETLEALTEGVAVFGSNGRLRLVNPAFLHQWILNAEKIKPEMRVDEVFALCAPQLHDKTIWSMLKGHITTINQQRYAVQGQMECKNGIILDWSTLPLPDGGTLLKFSDTTAATQMQRSLAERNDALEAAQKLKNDFIQHISYQLRSPLTNVIGFTELMQSKTAGKLTKKQEEYLRYIMSSSSSLLNIINDILDLVTVDAGIMALELAPIDPATAISQAVNEYTPNFEEKNIGLSINVPAEIGQFEADPRRLQQILTHLIGNAVSFSSEGQIVSISVLKSAEEMHFTISDQGCGIAPEEIAKVFDRFVSHKNNNESNVGLGLSIVKAFVELHNGAIKIDSTLGKGTSITCTFPIQPTKSKATLEHQTETLHIANTSSAAA